MLPGLPVPRLGPWATETAQQGPSTWEPWRYEWAQRFLHAVAERDAILARGPRQARWQIHEPNAGMWCVTHGEALLPRTPPRAPGPSAGERAADAPRPPGAEPPASVIRHFIFENAWTADDEAEMRSRDDGAAFTPAHQAMWNALELAILHEKQRRRQKGDHLSITRFDAERRRIGTTFETDKAYEQECRDETLIALLGGDDWGWWKYMPAPQARHIQAFLLGEDTGSSPPDPIPAALPPPDPPAVPAITAESPAADPIREVRTPVPAPEKPETPEPAPADGTGPFDPPWTAEDDTAMRTWALDAPWPDAFARAMQGLQDALASEKARRRERGDSPAIDQFERGRARWNWEWERNPDFRAKCDEDRTEARIRGEVHGFWGWLTLVQGRGVQSFLRGEPVDAAYADGPPSPKPMPHTFDFEAEWTFDDDVAMNERIDPARCPPAFWRIWDALELAIIEEKRRRRALGDPNASTRYDEARLAFAAKWNDDPTFQAQWDAEAQAARRRGDDYGWWKWLPIPLMHLMQGFLRGEEVGSYGEGPIPPPPAATEPPTAPRRIPTPPPTATAEPVTAERIRPVSDIPPPERWEPDWEPADTAAVHAMKAGDPTPARYLAAVRAMNAAVEREGRRRRQLGDTASVDRYNRDRQRFAEDAQRPDGEDAWQREFQAAQARGEDLGFWTFIPPAIAAITRAFLRGEGVEPYGEGPTAPRPVASETPIPPPPPAPPPTTAAVTEDRIPVVSIPPPERWQPEWGPEDTAACQVVLSGGDPPDRYFATITAMYDAVDRERERRLAIGDTASVERFDRERRMAAEAITSPEAVEVWHIEELEAKARGEDLGFWAFFPPGLATVIRPFLRGDGVHIAAPPAPTPSPPSDVPARTTPERRREIQEQAPPERAEPPSNWWER